MVHPIINGQFCLSINPFCSLNGYLVTILHYYYCFFVIFCLLLYIFCNIHVTLNIIYFFFAFGETLRLVNELNVLFFTVLCIFFSLNICLC